MDRAAEIISRGGVVIYPTDTVYGIGCDPYNASAVKRIYNIKSRDRSIPVPVLAGSVRDVAAITEIDGSSLRIASEFWPGMVTLILKLADDQIKESLMLGSDKIAVRVPYGPCIGGLLKRCRFVVGTSANVSGAGPFTDPDACHDSMSGFDLFLDGGKIGNNGVSTIVECTGGELRIHREGAVQRASLEELF